MQIKHCPNCSGKLVVCLDKDTKRATLKCNACGYVWGEYWTADEFGNLISCGDMPIAQTVGWCYLRNILHLSAEEATEIKKNNSRLIASAPALFEAVCDLLYYANIVLNYTGGQKETQLKNDIKEYEELVKYITGVSEKN